MGVDNNKIIKQLYKEFDIIQSKLVNKLVLGASKWILVNYKIIDDDELIEINMEDGHIQNSSVLKYSKEKISLK